MAVLGATVGGGKTPMSAEPSDSASSERPSGIVMQVDVGDLRLRFLHDSPPASDPTGSGQQQPQPPSRSRVISIHSTSSSDGMIGSDSDSDSDSDLDSDSDRYAAGGGGGGRRRSRGGITSGRDAGAADRNDPLHEPRVVLLYFYEYHDGTAVPVQTPLEAYIAAKKMIPQCASCLLTSDRTGEVLRFANQLRAGERFRILPM